MGGCFVAPLEELVAIVRKPTATQTLNQIPKIKISHYESSIHAIVKLQSFPKPNLVINSNRHFNNIRKTKTE